ANTPLAEFSKSLRQKRDDEGQEEHAEFFPMYTVHLEALLEMAEILPHEVLLADGVLTLFDRSKGQAMFVSHQWIGVGHPDPTLQQLRVLQDAISNSLKGLCHASVDVITEVLFGLRSWSLAEALKSKPVFVWYDYFSCPQQRKKAPDPEGSLQHAIDSIPAYVSKCSLFVALCPAVESADQSRVYNRSTWLDRGWCRLEWTMWNLSSVGEPVIFVKGARHLEVSKISQLRSVGEAAFSLEEDRHKVSKVLQVEFKKSLVKCLERGDLAKYRILLGWQKLCLRGLPDVPMESAEVTVPDYVAPSDSSAKTILLTRFLHQNGFRQPLERRLGWTPLCYAAMHGDPVLVSALLEQRASPNDRIHCSNLDLLLASKASVLELAARCRSNEVLKLLISERADLDGRDSIGVTALLAAAYSKDAAAVRLLCQARADPNVKNNFTDTAWHTACEAGSLPVLVELRAQSDGLTPNLERCLHTLSLGPGTAEAVHWLVDARADVNERMKPETFFISFVFAAKSLEYRFRGSRSQFCSIAYHHCGATPLVFAILAGNFEVAAALSIRGADSRIKNFRGKSAEDLAADMSAPSYLMELLERSDVCRFTTESRIIGAKQTSIESLRSEDYFEI
ncbi:unnamed protein product, partial [Symbiodinium microadriaticum]